MATTDRSLLDLGIKSSANDDDTLVSVVSNKASRLTLGYIKNLISQWNNLKNKPFDNISSDDFTITTDSLSGSTTLKLSPTISNNSHSHDNKRYLDKISESNDGALLYDSSPIGDWNTITNKPFESFSEGDFVIDESNVVSIGTSIKNQLHTHDNKEVIDKFSVDTNGNLLFNGQDIKADGIDFTALSGMLVQGDNITISTDEVAQTIKFSASGIDFESLSNALTTGIQSGISITADTDNNVFNFEVTGVPSLEIDSEGYWIINGERGTNPTKAQGEKGKDGASPTIDPNTKNWIVGTVDTGVKAEAQSNYFYTGTEFPTSDLIDGDLFLSFAEDTRGNVYQYQGTTLDWSLQGNLYGGGAVIDDTSTTGNTVTWSASKINSVIGNINTILASITGGVE